MQFDICGGAVTIIAFLASGLLVERLISARRRRIESGAINDAFDRANRERTDQ